VESVEDELSVGQEAGDGVLMVGNMWFFYQRILKQPMNLEKKTNLYIYIYPMDPSTFLGSVWDMIWGVKYLLRRCLDP